jgi:hypothetical protein
MARTSPQPNRRPAIGGNFDLLKRSLATDGNPVRFRQGKVIAYNSGANTVDVQIAGATDESGNAVVTAGIKLFGNFIPDINQAVWLVTDNTDIFAIGQLAPYGLAGGGGGGGTGNVAYQPDPPESPSIGDVWIESDVDLGGLILSDLGVTSTASELNILDGATLSTAELNLLDGVIASTAELNYVDGVTSAIQTQLNNRYTKTESDSTFVTKEASPVFAASHVGGAVSAGANFIFTVVHVNRGSGYNSTTGRFTAPVAGVYYFSFGFLSQNNANVVDMRFRKNGTTLFGGAYSGDSVSSYKQGHGSSAIFLAVNDYVEVVAFGGTSYLHADSPHNTYSGFLVS